MQAETKKDIKILGSLFVVALLFRVIFYFVAFFPKTFQWPDEITYYSIALKIHELGFWKFLSNEMSIWTAPANPFYIYFVHNLTLCRYLNIVHNSLLVFVYYWIGRTIDSRKVGLIAAALYVVYLPLVNYAPTILTEPLFISLELLGILMGLLAIEKRKTWLFFVTGLIFGLMALVRAAPALYPICLLLFMFVMFCLKKIDKDLLKKTAIFMLGAMMVILPVVIKNGIIFNKYTIATGVGAVLFLGSRVDTQGDEPPYRHLDYDTGKITDPYTHLQIEGDHRLTEVAKENIKNHFMEYLYFDVKKIGRLLIGSNLAWWSPFDNFVDFYHKFGVRTSLRSLVNLLLTIMVVIAGFSGLWRLCRTGNVKGLFLLSFILYYLVFSLPFLATVRYGIPIILLLIVFASYEFAQFKLSQLSRKALANYVLFRGFIMSAIFWFVMGGFV